MRTQFLYVGLLSMLAGGFVSAGCDDNHTGQGSDPAGPVKLTRILVQDATPNEILGYITDLLDTPGSPLSTAVPCDDLNPCQKQYTLGGTNPDFSCTKAGTCNDPLAPKQTVTITPPEAGAPGEAGGDQIRIVFNKLLNSSFETVTIDPAKLPGSNEKFSFAKGIVELDGPDGMAVPTVQYWDPAGSPFATADPVSYDPFGPAIVMKPANVLAPAATYTIKVTTSMITDRKGNPMADQNGNVLSGTYMKTFTTEDITPLAATPDVTSMGAMINTNDILQVEFNTSIDMTKSTCTIALGAAPVTVELFPENGPDPTACAGDSTFVNIYPVTAPGTPAAAGWAPGDYTIDCKFVDDQYGKGMFEYMGAFTVGTMAGDPMTDAQTIDNHQLPEMCM